MDTTLRPAGMASLATVLTWVGTPEQMRWWGGPALPFPGTPATVWAAIAGAPGNTFVLEDGAGAMVGFGQMLPRSGQVHLARLIVAPERRGQGLGRSLCQHLIRTAVACHRPDNITLNVYAGNEPAAALYRSLGFRVVPGAEREGVVRMALQAREPSAGRPGG